MLKRIITAAAIVTVTTSVQAAETCHPGYHCIDLHRSGPVGSPQDAQEDRERVRRAEQRVEEFRALKRSYEVSRQPDPNEVWAREENARQRVETERSSALRRERIDRLDAEWNAYRASERRPSSPQSITVIDSRGNAYFGTVQP